MEAGGSIYVRKKTETDGVQPVGIFEKYQYKKKF